MLSTTDDISKVNKKELEAQLGAGRINVERALSDKEQDPLSVWGFTNELKTISNGFSIRFRGLADWSTLEEDTIELYRLNNNVNLDSKNYEALIGNAQEKIPLTIKDKAQLSYGSNILNIISEKGNIEAGKYVLKISSNLRDPFSNPLDGNADGISEEGDNYYKLMNIEQIDHFSPLISSVEVIGDKTLTPENSEIRFVFDVEDDFSGFSKISLEIRENLKYKQHYQAVCDESCINKDGKIEVLVPASKLGIDGNYYVRSIKVYDKSKPSKESIYAFAFGSSYRGPKHAKKAISTKDLTFEIKGFKAKK